MLVFYRTENLKKLDEMQSSVIVESMKQKISNMKFLTEKTQKIKQIISKIIFSHKLIVATVAQKNCWCVFTLLLFPGEELDHAHAGTGHL